jgi:aspartate-semialdehyde dehydrogenase
MKVAVVGATGLVGACMMRVLEDMDFPVSQLIPVASERSVGATVKFRGKEQSVMSVESALAMRPALALFSAGASVSIELAPKFAEIGCRVIDNSSAWRMDPEKKLIVPEVNAYVLNRHDYIIANPNCSTIQMVMVLNPLHKKYKIKRVVVSTYQSVSGTGKEAVDELMAQRSGDPTVSVYPHAIDLNVIPHIDTFLENGYTKEEMKMILETQKIMEDSTIMVSPTAVRVPVVAGHSESVNIEFHNDFDLTEVVALLGRSYGIKVVDDPTTNRYPLPIVAAGKDDVFVGRIRRDISQPNALNCWIVADNLRKGAATNAVQIAKYMHMHGWIG